MVNGLTFACPNDATGRTQKWKREPAANILPHKGGDDKRLDLHLSRTMASPTEARLAGIFRITPRLQGQSSFFRCSREHRAGDDMRSSSHVFSSCGCKQNSYLPAVGPGFGRAPHVGDGSVESKFPLKLFWLFAYKWASPATPVRNQSREGELCERILASWKQATGRQIGGAGNCRRIFWLRLRV
jgi:hypothetical protein